MYQRNKYLFTAMVAGIVCVIGVAAFLFANNGVDDEVTHPAISYEGNAIEPLAFEDFFQQENWESQLDQVDQSFAQLNKQLEQLEIQTVAEGESFTITNHELLQAVGLQKVFYDLQLSPVAPDVDETLNGLIQRQLLLTYAENNDIVVSETELDETLEEALAVYELIEEDELMNNIHHFSRLQYYYLHQIEQEDYWNTEFYREEWRETMKISKLSEKIRLDEGDRPAQPFDEFQQELWENSQDRFTVFRDRISEREWL